MSSMGTGAPFNRRTGLLLAAGLVLALLLGDAYIALRCPCPQEPVTMDSSDHERLARYYREEAARLAADSGWHSALAVQYGAKRVSGPEAELWGALAAYSLLLASHELNAAKVMLVLAGAHAQPGLSAAPQPFGMRQGPP
jgi:hypothetical protein